QRAALHVPRSVKGCIEMIRTDDRRWTIDDGRWTMDDGRWVHRLRRIGFGGKLQTRLTPSSIVHRLSSNGLRTSNEPVPTVAPAQSGEISLARRLLDWKTLAGFGVSAAIAVLFALTVHLNLGAIWANIRAADVRYLA